MAFIIIEGQIVNTKYIVGATCYRDTWTIRLMDGSAVYVPVDNSKPRHALDTPILRLFNTINYPDDVCVVNDVDSPLNVLASFDVDNDGDPIRLHVVAHPAE
jgi:hypothetical protein